MKFQEHYDWIFFGKNPAAILAAATFVEQGSSVLIIPSVEKDQAPSSTGPTLEESFDPESNFVVGLGKSNEGEGPVYRQLSQLDFPLDEFSKVERNPSAIQVLTPEFRLALKDSRFLRLECDREFGAPLSEDLGFIQALELTEKESINHWIQLAQYKEGDSSNIKRFSLVESLLDLRKKLNRTADKLGANARRWIAPDETLADLLQSLGKPNLDSVFSGLWYSVLGTLPQHPSLFEILTVLNLAKASASFSGGVSAFREALLSHAKKLGAHVANQANCKNIFIEKGIFKGIQVTQHGNMITAKSGVIGAALSSIFPLVASREQKWIIKRSLLPKPTHWKFSIGLVVHREAIPPGISSRMVWVEENAPVIEMEICNPGEYGMSEPDSKLIYLRTFLSYEPDTLTPEFQSIIARRMFQQASEIIPFLDFHVVRVFPNVLSAHSFLPNKQGYKDLENVYPFKKLEDIPLELLCLSGKGVGYKTAASNLYVISGESYPEMGSFGPTIASLQLLRSVMQMKSIKKKS